MLWAPRRVRIRLARRRIKSCIPPANSSTPTIAPSNKLKATTCRCAKSMADSHRLAANIAGVSQRLVCGARCASSAAPISTPQDSGRMTRRVAMANTMATSGGNRLSGPLGINRYAKRVS